MPPSKNPKWYYLDYGESMRFKLTQIGSELDDKGKLVRFLVKPIFIHIRNYPFPNGKKRMPCAGERCEACAGGHKPTKFFPVNILLTSENPPKEYVMDMLTTAHSAVAEQIDLLVSRGATDDDVLQTEFQMTRLQRREKPFFVCTTVQRDFNPTPEELEFTKITEEDIKILRALTEKLKNSPDIKNPRGSVMITLKKKYEWPDLKINNAFENYLDDYGYLKE